MISSTKTRAFERITSACCSKSGTCGNFSVLLLGYSSAPTFGGMRSSFLDHSSNSVDPLSQSHSHPQPMFPLPSHGLCPKNIRKRSYRSNTSPGLPPQLPKKNTPQPELPELNTPSRLIPSRCPSSSPLLARPERPVHAAPRRPRLWR